MPIHEIQTSRGKILIRDDHMFEIVVPPHDQLLLSFQGESISFLVKGWLDDAKEKTFDGKRLDKPAS